VEKEIFHQSGPLNGKNVFMDSLATCDGCKCVTHFCGQCAWFPFIS